MKTLIYCCTLFPLACAIGWGLWACFWENVDTTKRACLLGNKGVRLGIKKIDVLVSKIK